jgi:hypothetical protein
MVALAEVSVAVEKLRGDLLALADLAPVNATAVAPEASPEG